MQRYILFTNPTETVMPNIIPSLFPKEIVRKVLAYMPCDGWSESKEEKQYTNFWCSLAKENNAKFVPIDNKKDNATEEIEKLKSANILLITGGNTFTLLHNLRKNHLDEAIIKFAQKKEFVIAGWSAGAIILTPSIALSTSKNDFGIKDISGLNIIKFEILPHFDKYSKERLKSYKKSTGKEVKTITEHEYIII